MRYVSRHIAILLILASTLAAACTNDNYHEETGSRGLVTDVIQHSALDGYTIHQPTAMVIDSPFVYIANELDSEIAVFDADLRSAGRFGAKGNGPGEFLRIGDIAVDRSLDRVLALGNNLRRLSIFNSDGAYLHEFRPPMSNWAQVEILDGEIHLLTWRADSDWFITRYSLSGDSLGAYIERPEIRVLPREAAAKMVLTTNQLIVAFSHSTRVVGRGTHTFDWEFPLEEAFPFLKRNLQEQERLAKLGGAYLTSVQGGMTLLSDHRLLLAGPMYHMRLLDMRTGEMRVVNLDPLAEQIAEEGGHGTYSDLAVMDNRLLAASRMASRVFSFKLSEVLNAAARAPVLYPETEEYGGK